MSLTTVDIPHGFIVVKLTLVNAQDPAFDRTETIYRAAGAEKNFVRK